MFTGSISTAEGSALVKLGNTTVVCGVKAVSIHQWCAKTFIIYLTHPDMITIEDKLNLTTRTYLPNSV